MDWTNTFACLSLVLYALATAASATCLLGRLPRVGKAAILLAAAGFALHTLWLASGLAGGMIGGASRGIYLMPFAWLLALAGFFLTRKKNMDIIAHLTIPWVFFLGACALGFSKTQSGSDLEGPLFLLHLVTIFIGVGVMAVASGAGAVFLWLERGLKKKRHLAGSKSDLPSLNTLDRINSIATLTGFPCYLLGLLSGFLWAHVSWEGSGGDIKEWVSLGILALYAVLFYQRFALGWTGKKPAMLAIAIFLASLFSMFVVNTIFSVNHGF